MKKILNIFLTVAVILFSSSLFADESKVEKKKHIEFYNSDAVLAAGLPFSEMVRVGNVIYLSGQIGAIPGTLKLAPGGIKGQAIQTMDNIKATLERYGYSMSDVVKCTVMLADISEWGQFNEVYMSYFEKPYPARSAFGANGLGMGSQLEVECIAAVE